MSADSRSGQGATSEETYLQLLREIDDRESWEFPRGFDYEAAERHFLEFVRELERACGLRLNAETGASIQDAAFHGQIFLRGWIVQRELAPHETVLLRVSNWGNLATLSEEAVIHPAAFARIRATLVTFGYRYVPPAVLALPYSGSARPYTGAELDGTAGTTWWIRFFDWW
jgi:hypothetical protein